MIKALVFSIVIFVSNQSVFAGVRGDTKISADGRLLVQLQDFPYTDSIQVFDMSSKNSLVTLADVKPLLFDDLEKTNCFSSSDTFAFVQKISPAEGYYQLNSFRLETGAILATKIVSGSVAIACNYTTNEVLLAEKDSIQILDGSTLKEKSKLALQNHFLNGFNGLGQIFLSPNEKYLVATDTFANSNSGFEIYDLERNRSLARGSFPYPREIKSAVFSLDSNFVALVDRDGMGRVYSISDGNLIFEFGHNSKFESLRALFDVNGNLYVADKLKEEDKVVVVNYGSFPFMQKWQWQVPGHQNQFNSFEVSKATGQLLIDTLTDLYLIDPAGTGRKIETSCINRGHWLFSPTQRSLFNAHEACGFTEIEIP